MSIAKATERSEMGFAGRTRHRNETIERCAAPAVTETSITMLLGAARGGNAAATSSLFNVVYRELKLLAHSHRRRWHGNETLNTTALISEAFLKLSGDRAFDFVNRKHFFATASRAMRQVLVNYALQQRAAKRGGDAVRVTLDETVFSAETTADEVLGIHEALQTLEASHPRRCRVIECRVFGGMSVEEVADVLGISMATVKREWCLGTAQLYAVLGGAE